MPSDGYNRMPRWYEWAWLIVRALATSAAERLRRALWFPRGRA